MKKSVSILIAGILMFGSLLTAMASSDSASPDEAESVKTVESIELTKLPNKLEYNYSDVEIDDEEISKLYEQFYSDDEEELDDEAFIERQKQIMLAMGKLFVEKMDKLPCLDGAEVTATYSDGTKEVVPNDECSLKIADPIDLEKFFELYLELQQIEFDPDAADDFEKYFDRQEEIQKQLDDLVFRDYTVEVSYQGATTDYTVKFSEPPEDPDIDDEYDIYEVESFTPPTKLTYTKDDITYIPYEESDDEGIYCEEDMGNDELYAYAYLELDLSGMSITYYCEETGDRITISDPEKLEAHVFLPDNLNELDKPNLVLEAYAIYSDDDEDEEDFRIFDGDAEFTVTLNPTDEPRSEDDTTKPAENPNQPSVINAKSSTADTVLPNVGGNGTANTSAKTDNGTIRTGSAFPVFASVMICISALACVFVYRRKLGK